MTEFSKSGWDQPKFNLDRLAHLYMVSISKDLADPLSVDEEKELNDFLATGSEGDIEKVKKDAEWRLKSIKYNNPQWSSVEERASIEQAMQTDPEFREYIEKGEAEIITQNYAMWRDEIENGPVDPKEPYEMTDDEIKKFFIFLDSYPDTVEESLQGMMADITQGDDGDIVVEPNEERYVSERHKLLELRDYIQGSLSARKTSDFNNELIDDIRFRKMFEKIKQALTEKK